MNFAERSFRRLERLVRQHNADTIKLAVPIHRDRVYTSLHISLTPIR